VVLVMLCLFLSQVVGTRPHSASFS